MRTLSLRGAASAVAAACLISLSPLAAVGQMTEPLRRTVSVGGEASISTSPDQATIRFNVITRDDDPEKARAANADASKKAMDNIRKLGVPEDKIRLEQYTLMPVKEWDQEQRKQVDAGFEANRSVTVKVDDLDLVPDVVTRVVQGGANQIGSVSYGLANDDEIRIKALSQAVENARFKASAMLEALGEKIGPVVEVREQSLQVPYPVMRSFNAVTAEKSADAVPEAYAPGQIEVTANVSVTFEIQ